MKKPNFDNLFEAAAFEMIASFTRSLGGLRPDEVGIPRENQVNFFLKDWLPEKYGISKGYLIDVNKNVSKECDIVIFENETCPKFFYDKKLDIRFFPKSEVLGFLEVKSTLNKKELANSLKKIKSANSISTQSIHDLVDLFGKGKWIEKDLKLAKYELDYKGNKKYSQLEFEEYKAMIKEDALNFSSPYSGIFAFRISKDLDLEGLKEKLKEQDIFPDIVIVLNKGVLVKVTESSLKRMKAMERNKSIKDISSTGDIFNELLSFRFSGKTDYLIFKSKRESDNLLYFYTFLLDYISEFKKYPNFKYADILSVWKKNAEANNE